MKYFFTSDEHYYHRNIIKYCGRSFKDVEEMNETIIERHNKKVGEKDTVIHAGDFCLYNNDIFEIHRLIDKLNGNHVFLRGSHDNWLCDNNQTRWEKTISGIHIVVDHYPLMTWPKSHYGSFDLHGHLHGYPPPIALGKQYDIGVDNNNFEPLSFDEIVEIMKSLPDNHNLIKK